MRFDAAVCFPGKPRLTRRVSPIPVMQDKAGITVKKTTSESVVIRNVTG
ncbi:MAG: hypothetical protein ACYC9O_15875 [Candidatus Latescibacterota bacterium]